MPIALVLLRRGRARRYGNPLACIEEGLAHLLILPDVAFAPLASIERHPICCSSGHVRREARRKIDGGHEMRDWLITS